MQVLEFQVNPMCEEMSVALQMAAEKNGYRWISSDKSPYPHAGKQYLVFGTDNRKKSIWTGGSQVYKSHGQVLTIEEAFKKFCTPIMAGNYPVTFNKEGIIVNGIVVSKDTVKQIWERLQ